MAILRKISYNKTTTSQKSDLKTKKDFFSASEAYEYIGQNNVQEPNQLGTPNDYVHLLISPDEKVDRKISKRSIRKGLFRKNGEKTLAAIISKLNSQDDFNNLMLFLLRAPKERFSKFFQYIQTILEGKKAELPASWNFNNPDQADRFKLLQDALIRHLITPNRRIRAWFGLRRRNSLDYNEAVITSIFHYGNGLDVEDKQSLLWFFVRSKPRLHALAKSTYFQNVLQQGLSQAQNRENENSFQAILLQPNDFIARKLSADRRWTKLYVANTDITYLTKIGRLFERKVSELTKGGVNKLAHRFSHWLEGWWQRKTSNENSKEKISLSKRILMTLKNEQDVSNKKELLTVVNECDILKNRVFSVQENLAIQSVHNACTQQQISTLEEQVKDEKAKSDELQTKLTEFENKKISDLKEEISQLKEKLNGLESQLQAFKNSQEKPNQTYDSNVETIFYIVSSGSIKITSNRRD